MNNDKGSNYSSCYRTVKVSCYIKATVVCTMIRVILTVPVWINRLDYGLIKINFQLKTGFMDNLDIDIWLLSNCQLKQTLYKQY